MGGKASKFQCIHLPIDAHIKALVVFDGLQLCKLKRANTQERHWTFPVVML